MLTIVKPKEHIAAIWGKQKIKKNEKYRLMRYILKVDYDNKVLLHNVVTGQLMILDDHEAQLLEKRTVDYTSAMDELVTNRYLVPVDYDEHQQVVNLRSILRRLDDLSKPKHITNYIILPTTACNARCYYCFEQGMKVVSMSKSTADNVVDFISKNCGEQREVYINWFGGEPTIAHQRIDQISDGLREKGIKYSSMMVTNGYLFDEEMAAKAKKLWNVTGIQITVDGTESNNNRIKAFANAMDNPYQKVLANIGLLLEQGIDVSLRMNYDVDNYDDFSELLREVTCRYHYNPHLTVYAHPILGEYKNTDGIVHHGNDKWLSKINAELNTLSRRAGLAKTNYPLPSLEYRGCSADRDSSIAIHPSGMFSRCMELFCDEQSIGNVNDGIMNKSLVQSWKQVADYERCQQCVMFPKCVLIKKCSGGDRCYSNEEFALQCEQAICNYYKQYMRRKE